MPTPTPAATQPAEITQLVPAQGTQAQMSFPAAMQKVKDGRKVRRAVWPMGHYAFLAQRSQLTVDDKGAEDVPGYLAQRHKNGGVDCILFTQVDVEADDWEVVA